MDIFAHGLWSYAIFHRKRYVWLAVLFGVLPDILSFGVFVAENLINGNIQRGPPPINTIPLWVFASYNLTHSFVVFIATFLLIYLLTKSLFWPLTAWGIHIMIDIPTHSSRFFPTPFLWPLSSYTFDGISWFSPWFMILNYSTLLVVFVVIAYNRAKGKKPTTKFKK